MIRNTISITLTALVLVAVIIGCATTGPGGKQSLILIPTDTEIALGQQMDVQVRAENKILADSVWHNYINEVGQSIVAVCDRKDIQYHFEVIESDAINAFATPGGYIYFYTGILKMMDSEAELASVMAHEISHVVARHGVKQMQAAMGASMLYELIAGEDRSEAMDMAANVGMGLIFAGYSRSAENEADNFGVTYMSRAGYDPHGAVSMFSKMAQAGSGNRSVFENLFSSHPETQERINNIESQITGMILSSSLRTNRDRYQAMKARLPK